MNDTRVFIIMGVCASGKTVVARNTAERLACPFLEGDEFHPDKNVDKMSAGIPLTDEDRIPWIETICSAIQNLEASACVVACSALNDNVRSVFEKHFPDKTHYILLKVSRNELAKRLQRRKGHFMLPTLLDSQLKELIPPTNAYEIDGEKPLSEVIRLTVDHINGQMTFP